MAKKVKFALEMADGEQVRNIDTLKEHFNLEKMVGYYLDGRLLTWLKDRYYIEEADKVAALSKSDPQLHNKLCDIFGVESEVEELDVEEIARRTERLNKLKQYTYDRDVLERVDQVAFDQEDLSDLLDEDMALIYLCNNNFVIPLKATYKTYVGIGKAIAIIRSDEIVDFDSLHIKFVNVNFNDGYESVLAEEQKRIEEEKAKLPEKLYNEAQSAYESKDYKTALEKYRKSADLGYAKAMCKVALMYRKGKGTSKDSNEAINWYIKAVELGDTTAMVELGHIYRNGSKTIQQDFYKAAKYFKQAAEAGDGNGMNGLGMLYDLGQGVAEDKELAFKWYLKAAEAGSDLGMANAGNCYMLGRGTSKDSSKAENLLKKSAENGNYLGMMKYGIYFFQSESYEKALKWFQNAYDKSSGVEAGRAAYAISKAHRKIGEFRKKNSPFKQGIQGMINNGLALGFVMDFFDNTGKEDFKEADKWLEKAKQLGYHC